MRAVDGARVVRPMPPALAQAWPGLSVESYCLSWASRVVSGLLGLDEVPQSLDDGTSHLATTHTDAMASWRSAKAALRALWQDEVAATAEQQAIGLQLRPPLPPLRGMWFPYAMPTPARFWMHRTPAPLDMLFIRDGVVTAIEAHTRPCMRLPCPSYGPPQPVDGVLELAAGQAEALGIRVGSPVRIEALP